MTETWLRARKRSAVHGFRGAGLRTRRIQADTDPPAGRAGIGPTISASMKRGMRCDEIQGPPAARSDASLRLISLGDAEPFAAGDDREAVIEQFFSCIPPQMILKESNGIIE